MAHTAARHQETSVTNLLYCPMIDARRMEVFTALFDKDLSNLMEAQPVILTDSFLHEECKNNTVVVFGSGSQKFMSIANHHNFVFKELNYDGVSLAKLCYESFEKNDFADIAYAEPQYAKSFTLI